MSGSTGCEGVHSRPGRRSSCVDVDAVEHQITTDLRTTVPDFIAVDNPIDAFDKTSLPLDTQTDITAAVFSWLSPSPTLSSYVQFTSDIYTPGHGLPSFTDAAPSSGRAPQLSEIYGHDVEVMFARQVPYHPPWPITGSLETRAAIASGFNTYIDPFVHNGGPMIINNVSSGELSAGDKDDNEDEDAEGVMEIITPELALDRDVTSNSLPFILSSYLKAMMRSLFEPMIKAHGMRDFLIQRCTTSDDLRYTATLLATVADLLSKKANLSAENVSVITLVENYLWGHLALVKSRLQSEPKVYANDAFMAIRHMHEMMIVQSLFGSMTFHVKMLDQIASIYQLMHAQAHRTSVHLQSTIFHPNPELRHITATDILLSLSSCRPMIFHYDTTMSNLEYDVNRTGMQWKTGLPDYFLVLLAQMNTLRQDYAPNIDYALIDSLNTQIASFEPNIERTPDSYLYIARLTIQECWRQFMYIYLYMGLCGVNSHDARAVHALKRFIDVLDRVKPGRMPDAFLVTPMSLAGMAAHKSRDRGIIRQHFYSLCEYYQPGTYVNDVGLILETVWAAADAQQRPTVWLDLRLACEAVTGIV
ncbi:Fungal specific transcription factor domain [Ceratobasidium sp. AG-Ba]|nr:Fungal specific transcription factor domain [Ceratobasidium sp. AG-Ba]